MAEQRVGLHPCFQGHEGTGVSGLGGGHAAGVTQVRPPIVLTNFRLRSKVDDKVAVQQPGREDHRFLGLGVSPGRDLFFHGLTHQQELEYTALVLWFLTLAAEPGP